MGVLRLTIPTILFVVILVGCIVQADTYSDQNPFSVPDTLQSGGDMSVQGSPVDPKPEVGRLTKTPTPPPSPPETTTTPTPEPTTTPTPAPTATIDKDDYIPTATPEYPPVGK